MNPSVHPQGVLGSVESVYQPIVDLSTGALVGFEALARPAAGSEWTSAGELFDAAAARRVTTDLDWQCRVSAVNGALAAGLPRELFLFVNAEPPALDSPPPGYALPILAEAARLSIVVEITERHLMQDPAGLLRAAAHARDMGWRIAIDDVGADSSSLALLALLRPDVIKLDMSLVHQRSTAETAAILASVAAESERTGAVVVAEGIENEVHQQRAAYMGAEWGQGWLFGAPAPMPEFRPTGRELDAQEVGPAVTVRAPAAVTPFGLMRRDSTKIVDEDLLETLETNLLSRASAMGSTAVVLTTDSSPVGMSVRRQEVLSELTSRTALTVAFGSAVPTDGDIRTVRIDPREPLASERSVVVVDPLFYAALIALDTGVNPDGSRIYEYRLTFDREQVLDAATLLVHRIEPRVEQG